MNASFSTRVRSCIAMVALVVLAFATPAVADFSNTAYFSFSGCSWKAVGGDLGIGYNPFSRTVDLNGGCRYLDADVRYREVGGGSTVYTKWCATVNGSGMTCSIGGKIHDDSRSRAQSWETDHWQSSGWWL